MLDTLIIEKTIRCVDPDRDRYGRLVLACFARALHLHASMVEDGWALADRQDRAAYVRQGVIGRPRGVYGCGSGRNRHRVGGGWCCHVQLTYSIATRRLSILQWRSDAVWLGFRSSTVVVEARKVPDRVRVIVHPAKPGRRKREDQE